MKENKYPILDILIIFWAFMKLIFVVTWIHGQGVGEELIEKMTKKNTKAGGSGDGI